MSIIDKAAQIRSATYGKDVRESIASGIEEIDSEVVSNSVMHTAREEALETRQLLVEIKENNLEDQFNGLIINAGDSNAEIVAGRTSNVTGITSDTIGHRVDAVDIHLKNIDNDIILNKFAYNFKYLNFPILTKARKERKTSNREILALGDSHGWGQGSTDDEWIEGQPYFSSHMAIPYNGGFYARLEKYIKDKFGFYESSINFSTLGSNKINKLSNVTPLSRANNDDINKQSDNIIMNVGLLKLEQDKPLINPQDSNFYNPTSKNMSSDVIYGYNVFRQKFGKGCAIFSNCNNKIQTKSYNSQYITITPNTSYSENADYTQYKFNGGIYYGFNTSSFTNQFIHICGQVRPDWLIPDIKLLIEGYGYVKVTSIVEIDREIKGFNIFITNIDGSIINKDLSGFLYPGKQLYLHSGNGFEFRVRMREHASKMYLGVLKTPNSSKLNIYFREDFKGIRETDLFDDVINPTTNTFYKLKNGYPIVTRVVNGDFITLDTNEFSFVDNKIIIDTYSPSNVDVVYCVDWGFKQKGEIVFEYGGENVSAVKDSDYLSTLFYIRGIFFDRNTFLNHSMGGHTTGAWLGTMASFNDSARNHIADIKKYLCFTPTLLLIQAPIVNEYLNQTTIQTFKNNLDSIISTLNSHRSPAETKNMDVLFFTTVADRTKDYSGTDLASIKYNDYFNGLKEYCNSNNYGLIDFREGFKDMVSKNIIDYDFLYDNDIHPSPFVNEYIAKELYKAIDLIM